MDKKIYVVGIDWQKDFGDQPAGALPVPGGTAAAEAFARMISDNASLIHDIRLTLDSHPYLHVAHNWLWLNKDGNPIPHTAEPPFEPLTVDKLKSGDVRCKNKNLGTLFQKYIEEAGGAIPIWPAHCLIGSVGTTLIDSVEQAARDWEKVNIAQVEFITKGSNPFTDQFGALEACVPNINEILGFAPDPTTQLNMREINMLQDADAVIYGGLATDYCVKNTMEQYINNLPDEFCKKCWICTDAMSAIIPDQGQAFFDDMVARGMNLTTTKEVFGKIL